MEMKLSSDGEASWKKEQIKRFLASSQSDVQKLLELVQPKLVDKYFTNMTKWNQDITLKPPPGGKSKDAQYEARRIDLTCLIKYLQKLGVTLGHDQEEQLEEVKKAINWEPSKEGNQSWGSWISSWVTPSKK
jgi:hypothetical protein